MAQNGKSFPPGFLWGTATAAHQVEGGNRNSDWWEWEQTPGHIQDGDSSAVACDHYNRFKEDFQLLSGLSNNAHRLSIEWSRVEPEEGSFDARQLRHYRDVLGELRERGMAPMLTLHHFTSPLWFTRRGGWAAAGSALAFARFVTRVADELGDLVSHWCTINEPNIYAANGWLVGEFPPGRRGDLAGSYRVLANLREAHEAAYAELKRRFPDAPVGLSFHKFLFIPATQSRRDRLAAGTATAFMDRWPASIRHWEPILASSCDYIGIAHYWGQLAAFDPLRPQEQFIRRFNPPGLALTDMGWASKPEWLAEVLRSLKRYAKPVLITENGISTSDDSLRERFLLEMLEQVRLAIADGVDVRGYYHWSAIDNFEWARGYSQRFGLIACDRRTLERTVKPSGKLYGRIARANALPD